MSAKVTERYTQICDEAQRRAVELLDQPTPPLAEAPKDERIYRA
jgi:hypothetical protein